MKTAKLLKLKEICIEYDMSTGERRRILGLMIDDYGERMSKREISEFILDFQKKDLNNVRSN